MNPGKIVVVMGGPSSEAEVSRRTGKAILDALLSKGYNAEGLELNPLSFVADIQKTNCAVVFNALHGKYGEDGILQGTLDMLDIPYTGSGVLAAALTMNKVAAKRAFVAAGISTPRYLHLFERDKDIELKIKQAFSFPAVIKAIDQGSSIGVYIVNDEAELKKSLSEVFAYSKDILAEEFIAGRELTVAVWGNSEQQSAMPVIEITTTSGRYDYESKYTKGASQHLVPAELSAGKTEEVQKLAADAFAVCGCQGVARVDIMLDKNEKPYVIEVNSVPGMTETSLVPDAARAMGVEFPELCEKILALAGFGRE